MENKQHSEQDALAQAFRDKLAHHSMPVDNSAWDAIQSRLNAATAHHTGSASGMKLRQTQDTSHGTIKRRAAFWWVSISAAASLALLLTFGWLYQQQQEPIQESIAKLSPANQLSDAEDVQVPIPEDMQLSIPDAIQSPAPNKAIKSAVSVNHTAIINRTASPEVVITNEQSVAVVEDTETKINVTEPSKDKKVLDEEREAVQSSGSQEPREKTKILKPSKLNELIPASNAREDWTQQLPVKKGRPMLAAALGSGFSGGNPSGSGGLYMDAMSESFLTSSNAPMRAKALSAADFDKKVYLPPLSAGVKIRFPFDLKWSLETGIQYTFLHTSLSNEQWTGSTAEMKLHYLGIPIGLAVTLTDSPRWQLYLSGGILAEKGLQSVYDEYRDWGSAVFNTHVSKGIDGLQWSLYSAIGAGYHLDRTMMLYFEPQLSYYFDSNQPLSVRTEQPFMPGLTAGIRFSF